MAVTIINSGNQAEHVLIKSPDGKQDTVTCPPGRSTLAEGWSVVDTGISIRHLRVVVPESDVAVKTVAAKQAATSPQQLAAAESKASKKE